MKKILAFLLVAAALFAYTSCGGYESDYKPDVDYYENTPRPENGIFPAPDTFSREWDIPSVRNDSEVKDGYYSMPVYRIDTYGDLLHLKDIVGVYYIGNEVKEEDNYYCEACKTSTICAHKQYNEEFFANYSLLIGWCQYKGLVLPEHVVNNNGETQAAIAKYQITRDGDLYVELDGEFSDSESAGAGQWVLVAVPKYKMHDNSKITVLVKLPVEDESDEPTDEPTDETPNETPEQGTEEQ